MKHLPRILEISRTYLESMIELEQPVYGCWLEQPKEILGAFKKFFEPQKSKASWGRLLFVWTTRFQS